ncbi:MAG: hypothetical protein K2G09_03245 [Paramuribaculum sp.]|nr:hypothetical protein [Paramuribaculum sp.]
MIKTIEIGTLKCVCIPNRASKRVVYMIYPAVSVFSEDWLTQQAEKNSCSLVAIYVAPDEWDNLLTPWQAPGVPKGSAPFKGQASEFYDMLISKVIPEAENTLATGEIDRRDLAGVSLAGLFTLWQWMQFNTFHSIACISGSFWYSGFMEWFESQQIHSKEGLAYFLLGIEEPKANIKAFRPVG